MLRPRKRLKLARSANDEEHARMSIAAKSLSQCRKIAHASARLDSIKGLAQPQGPALILPVRDLTSAAA
jgi:hypothetical protein